MLAAWLVWTLAAQHADESLLAAAARAHQVPVMVMLGVAAVESGYAGGNDWRGMGGEIGRMQIQLPTARAAGCGQPLQLEVYGRNIACGARILRRCYERTQSWPLAVRCYNGPSLPPSTEAYLAKVEREIGRMRLAAIGTRFEVVAAGLK